MKSSRNQDRGPRRLRRPSRYWFREAIFAFDHHDLEPASVARWLARSGVRDARVTTGPEALGEPTIIIDVSAGPRRTAPFDLAQEIDAVLASLDAPVRWYELPSTDVRNVFVRMDRGLTGALGVGLFTR
ncbi:MAG: hypothetical protein JNK05_04390 [Myxococcales bacterium]|nr:hypothetical protein [Myxococcales bacterium]